MVNSIYNHPGNTVHHCSVLLGLTLHIVRILCGDIPKDVYRKLLHPTPALVSREVTRWHLEIVWVSWAVNYGEMVSYFLMFFILEALRYSYLFSNPPSFVVLKHDLDIYSIYSFRRFEMILLPSTTLEWCPVLLLRSASGYFKSARHITPASFSNITSGVLRPLDLSRLNNLLA